MDLGSRKFPSLNPFLLHFFLQIEIILDATQAFNLGRKHKHYPKHPVHKMGKFTQNVYGIKWVKLRSERYSSARESTLCVGGTARSGISE